MLASIHTASTTALLLPISPSTTSLATSSSSIGAASDETTRPAASTSRLPAGSAMAVRLRAQLEKSLMEIIRDPDPHEPLVASMGRENKKLRDARIDGLSKGINYTTSASIDEKVESLEHLLNEGGELKSYALRKVLIRTLPRRSDTEDFTKDLINHLLPLASAIPSLKSTTLQTEAIQWLSSLAKYLPEQRGAICNALADVCIELNKPTSGTNKQVIHFATQRLNKRKKELNKRK